MRWWRGAVGGGRAADECGLSALANQDDVTHPLLARKLSAIHLYLADGALVEDAATLFDRFDDMDIRLVRWLGAGLMDALQELMSLGEAKRRLLFDGVEMAAAKTPTPPWRTTAPPGAAPDCWQ